MYKFTGLYESMFTQYKDAETGATLVAKPGESYSILPAVPGVPSVPAGFELAESPEVVIDQLQHELDRMADESGVDHTESE